MGHQTDVMAAKIQGILSRTKMKVMLVLIHR
jgi:hypothetical protein